jgi:hypothetical protein
MIRYLLAALVILPVLVLVVGAATGRVRVRSCCAPTDPAKDLRMRGAFEDEADRAVTHVVSAWSVSAERAEELGSQAWTSAPVRRAKLQRPARSARRREASASPS